MLIYKNRKEVTMKSKYTFPLINITLVFVIIYLLSKVSYVLTPVKAVSKVLFIPFIISLFIYYILRPGVRLIQRKVKKMPKTLSIVLVLLAFVVFLSTVVFAGILAVEREFDQSFAIDMNSLMDYFYVIDNNLGGILTEYALTSQIVAQLQKVVMNVSTSMFSVFSSVSNITFQLFIIPFILFYLLKEDGGIIAAILEFVPKSQRHWIKKTLENMDKGVSTYIGGQLLVATVIGILMFIAYLIIGMPNALLMAFFSMITSIIPFVGPFLGIIPAMLVGLTIDVWMLVKIFVAMQIVQQIEGNLITPNLMGNKLNLHPLAIFLIVIISVTLFGVMGAFIGIPTFIVLAIVVKDLYFGYIKGKIAEFEEKNQ